MKKRAQSVYKIVKTLTKNNNLTKKQRLEQGTKVKDENGVETTIDHNGHYKLAVVAEVEPHLPYVRTKGKAFSRKVIKLLEKRERLDAEIKDTGVKRIKRKRKTRREKKEKVNNINKMKEVQEKNNEQIQASI